MVVIVFAFEKLRAVCERRRADFRDTDKIVALHASESLCLLSVSFQCNNIMNLTKREYFPSQLDLPKVQHSCHAQK